jgi:putative membrane protein
MKNKFILTSSAIVATATVCLIQAAMAAEKSAKAEKSAGVSSADKKFVEAAAQGGMMEVAWGKEASSRGSNGDVKEFGNMMVRDHSKANNELKSIAGKKGISIPNENSQVNFKTDADYMSMMVKDHKKDLSEFKQEAQNGSDPDLKAFADKTSKIIEHHLSEAQRINKSLKHEHSSIAR